MDQIAVGSPRPNARIIGVVYLSYFLTAFLGGFLLKGFVVSGDAAATANSILAHEALYRSGFAVGLIANVLYIAVATLLYGLFEPVNRILSLLAAFVGLVGCAIQIFAGLLQLAPFVVLGESHALNAFNVEQLQMAAQLCLKLYSQTFSISLVMFAFYDLLVGYLIFTSTFLPRIIGVIMMCAGAGWLAFVWPPLATAMSPYVLPFGALAELLLTLWLIVKGVDTSRWRGKVGTEFVAGA
jgi:hypothetical protein